MLILILPEAPYLGGLHVTCYAHFLTWPSYSSQKSCVKIWFGLVEHFKSYRGNIKKTGKAARLWYTWKGAYNNRKHLKIWESALFSG